MKPTSTSPEPEAPKTPAAPAPATPETPEAPAAEPAEGEEGEGDPAPAADPAPEAAAAGVKPSVFDRAAAFLSGKNQLVNQLAAAHGQIATATAEIGRLNAEIVTLNASNATLAEQAKKVPVLEAEKTTVAKGVQKELGSLGLSPAEAPSQLGSEQTPEALLEKFQTLNGADKTAFFRANKAALLVADAAAKKK